MKYWYKISDSQKWEKVMLEGGEFNIPIYEETEEILKSFESEEFSDWWPLRLHNSYAISDENGKFEFASLEDAYVDLYTELGEDLYCKQHGC
jgi:hypothetical protein